MIVFEVDKFKIFRDCVPHFFSHFRVPMTEERDNEWSEMFAKIPIEPETEINKSAQSNMNTLLQIPYWLGI